MGKLLNYGLTGRIDATQQKLVRDTRSAQVSTGARAQQALPRTATIRPPAWLAGNKNVVAVRTTAFQAVTPAAPFWSPFTYSIETLDGSIQFNARANHYPHTEGITYQPAFSGTQDTVVYENANEGFAYYDADEQDWFCWIREPADEGPVTPTAKLSGTSDSYTPPAALTITFTDAEYDNDGLTDIVTHPTSIRLTRSGIWEFGATIELSNIQTPADPGPDPDDVIIVAIQRDGVGNIGTMAIIQPFNNDKPFAVAFPAAHLMNHDPDPGTYGYDDFKLILSSAWELSISEASLWARWVAPIP